MKRITVKDLKEKIAKLPDDTLVVLQSDSEGNSESTCLDMWVDKVGYEQKIAPDFTYVGGQETIGIDQTQDKGRYMLVLQPSL